MRGQRSVYNSCRPELHDVLRRWRAIADDYDPNRILLGETYVFDPSEIAEIATSLRARDVDAVAVMLLNSYRDPTLEIAVADLLREALGQEPDLVISDMAANTVGHAQTDHLRTMGLVEAAAQFAVEKAPALASLIVANIQKR